LPVGQHGLLVCRPVPWTAKPFYWRKPPPWFGNRNALNKAQLGACIALGEAATAAYGTKGKTPYKGFNMPSVAVKVAMACAGKSYGGLSREERARRAHEAAAASLTSLRTILAHKG